MALRRDEELAELLARVEPPLGRRDEPRPQGVARGAEGRQAPGGGLDEGVVHGGAEPRPQVRRLLVRRALDRRRGRHAEDLDEVRFLVGREVEGRR